MEAYTEHDAAAEAADGKRRDYGAADVAAMNRVIGDGAAKCCGRRRTDGRAVRRGYL